MRILLIEDEPMLRRSLFTALREEGFDVDLAGTLEEARQTTAERRPDLILLDLMLPDGSGLEFLQTLRRRSWTPVIVITARDSLNDRVGGLDGGADDYLVKPFELDELLARIRALLRRRGARETLDVGDLSIDLDQRRVSQSGRLVFLSTTEFSILEILARNLGTPVSKTELLRYVWDDEQRHPNVLEVYMNHLRHKLERAGSPRLIHTIRGQGYVLAPTVPL